MSPPSDSADNPVIDPTHMRTQADYHFALGESLSLDGESDRAIEEFKLAMVYDNAAAAIPLRLGSEYLRKGLLTEAVEQGEAAQKLEPENIDVHEFLGGLYSALKMYKQALENYSFILKKDPRNEDVLIYVGAMYAEQEKYSEAESYFNRAAQLPTAEKAHLAYYYLGKMRTLQNPKNSKPAEKAFEQALGAKPEFEEGVLALSDLYRKNGDKNRSLKLLESFQDQFGPKKSIAYELSQIYLDEEKYDKAAKHLRVLESFEPNNLNVKVKIALILIEKKTYEEAIAKLEEIVVIAPTSDKIRFYLAAVYEEVGRADLAISNFKKIENSSTYFPDAVIHAAHLYRKQQDLKGSAKILKEAIDQRDDVPQFYAFYASVLDEQKEYKTAAGMLEKAAKKFPDNTQIRFYLGSMYDRMGRQQETIAEMRKILALDQDHIQALNYLAYTYAEMSTNLEEAESLALRAMAQQPQDAYILDTVGWVMFKQGRVEDAIQYLEAAMKLKPEESIIAEHLGDAYYVFELAEKAKQMYLKAVAFESDPSKANKIRAKIINIDASSQQRVPASLGK